MFSWASSELLAEMHLLIPTLSVEVALQIPTDYNRDRLPHHRRLSQPMWDLQPRQRIQQRPRRVRKHLRRAVAPGHDRHVAPRRSRRASPVVFPWRAKTLLAFFAWASGESFRFSFCCGLNIPLTQEHFVFGTVSFLTHVSVYLGFLGAKIKPFLLRKMTKAVHQWYFASSRYKHFKPGSQGTLPYTLIRGRLMSRYTVFWQYIHVRASKSRKYRTKRYTSVILPVCGAKQ